MRIYNIRKVFVKELTRQRIFRRSPVINITQVIFNCILINNTKTYISIEIKI
jgi:hypothetical protein